MVMVQFGANHQFTPFLAMLDVIVALAQTMMVSPAEAADTAEAMAVPRDASVSDADG